MAITIDVFPISFDYERYPLIAYGLKGTGSTQSGGRLAYRVRKRLKIPCIWLKNPNRLIATPQLTLEMLTSLLEELWQSLPDDFGQITGVYADSKWQSSEYAIAQFIAQGVLSDTDQVLRTSLQKEKKTVGTVLIENRRTERVSCSRNPLFANRYLFSLDESAISKRVLCYKM